MRRIGWAFFALAVLYFTAQIGRGVGMSEGYWQAAEDCGLLEPDITLTRIVPYISADGDTSWRALAWRGETIQP